MASAFSSKLLFLRRLSRALKLSSSSSSSLSVRPYVFLLEASRPSDLAKINLRSFLSVASRSFCSRTLDLEDDSQGPAAIDYRFVLFINFSVFLLFVVCLVAENPNAKERKICYEKKIN